jgi:hypothetical protein
VYLKEKLRDEQFQNAKKEWRDILKEGGMPCEVAVFSSSDALCVPRAFTRKIFDDYPSIIGYFYAVI